MNRRQASPGDAAGRHDRRGLQPDDHRQRRHRHAHVGREQHPGRNRRLDRPGQRHGKPGRQRHAHGRREPRRSPSPPPIRLGATTTTNYSITVNPRRASAPATLPADTVGVAYNQTITASGGTGTVTLGREQHPGPNPGLTVPASGTGSLVVSGTPTAAGTETFTLTATDALGANDDDELLHLRCPTCCSGSAWTERRHPRGRPATTCRRLAGTACSARPSTMCGSTM